MMKNHPKNMLEAPPSAASPSVDFKAAFEACPHPAVILQADVHFPVAAVNDRYLDATCTRREELVGRSIFDVFRDDPNDPKAVFAGELRTSLAQVMRDKVADVMGVVGIDIPPRNGCEDTKTRYWSPVNTPVLGADGTLSHILHNFEDITDTVNVPEWAAVALPRSPKRRSESLATAEAEVRHQSAELQDANRGLKAAMQESGVREAGLTRMNVRLQELDRARFDFLSNLSHEIRTPLNAILGLTQVVLDSELNPLQSDYLKKVRSSSVGLLGIINQVLDYSRLEAGQLELEARDFSLDELLHSIAGMFPGAFENKDIELVFEGLPQVPRMLNGDAHRLGQVLNNLVGNAMKFTEHGEVRVQIHALNKNPKEVPLRISVRDTGIGMTPGQMKRLFKPFSQADASTTRRFGGTGLGLALSRRLVERMGGTLHVKSVLGEGSTFTFTVRLSPAKDPTLGAFAGNLKKMRTLIVDDQESALVALSELLASWGFPVSAAHTGKEALTMKLDGVQSGNPFELFLIDWKMPVMDGFEAAERIHAQEGKEGLPIIAMTAAGLIQDRSATAAAGMIDHIPKPICIQELVSTLLRHIPHAEPPKTRMGRPEEPDDAPRSGLDLESAARRMGGDLPLLHRAMMNFLRDHHDLDQKLGACLSANGKEEAVRLLHTLRGHAGTIGAAKLQRLSGQLEGELRAALPLATRKPFEDALEEVLSALRAIPEPLGPLQEGTPHEPGRTRRLLGQARTLLENSAYVPRALQDEIRVDLTGYVDEPTLDDLFGQVQNFRYSQAKVALERIACALPF